MTTRAQTLALLLLITPALTGLGTAAPGWKERRRAADFLCLALLEVARDDPAAALRALDAATVLTPDDPRPRFLRVVLRVEAGEALEATAEIEKIAGMVEAPPAALAAVRLRALRALDRKKEEIQAAEIAAAATDEGVEPCLWRAWSLLVPGVERLRGAQAACVAAIRAHEKKDPFLGRLTLAVAYRRLGDVESALGQARIAARNRKSGAWAQVHLAEIHRLRGDRKAEVAALARARLLDSGNAMVRVRIADIAVADGDLNGAADLLAGDDPSPAGRWTRAWVALRFGDSGLAVADLAPALEIHPEWGVPGGVDVDDARLHAGLRENIRQATERLEKADPELLPGLYLRLRGRSFLEMGRHAEALADLLRSIEVEPVHGPALAPLILRARVEAKPDEALGELEDRLKRAIGDERIALADLRVRAHLRRKDWPAAAAAAGPLRELVASRDRDLAASGVESGSRRRTELARIRALATLVEARGLLASNPTRAATLAREVIDGASVDVRAEALALLSYLRTRRGARDAALYLEEALRLHEPTRLRERGPDHVLNGWTWRFVSESRRLAGDEKGSAAAFASAIREGLPRWAEELP